MAFYIISYAGGKGLNIYNIWYIFLAELLCSVVWMIPRIVQTKLFGKLIMFAILAFFLSARISLIMIFTASNIIDIHESFVMNEKSKSLDIHMRFVWYGWYLWG